MPRMARDRTSLADPEAPVDEQITEPASLLPAGTSTPAPTV